MELDVVVLTPRRGDSQLSEALSSSPQREPPVQRQRLNEEGDSVPGSQDTQLAAATSRLSVSEEAPLAASVELVDEQNAHGLVANGTDQRVFLCYSIYNNIKKNI